MQFQEIVGQARAKELLLRASRDNRLSHAILLSGPSGAGKLAFANAIAQFLNCDNPTETDSCGKCPSCEKTRKGVHPDVHYVLPIISKVTGGKPATSDDFIEAFRTGLANDPYFHLGEWTSALEAEKKQLFIPIAEMRALKRKLALKSFENGYKVVIVWHAEKINVEASNAFLKLLEEPPDKTVIILTAESGAQLLPTITSRCQRIQFERLSRDEIQDYLITHHSVTPAHARDASLLSDGSMVNAIEILNHTSEPFAANFIDWMRLCYEGLMQKMQKWSEEMAGQTLEFQKLYLEYALKKLRDAFLFNEQAGQLALATDQERPFLEKFGQFLVMPNAEMVYGQMEQSLYYISRNANANMVFLALCMRIHQIIRQAR